MQAQASTPSEDAGARNRTWFIQGMGFAALIMIGVYRMGGGLVPSGSAKSPGREAAFAFQPAVLGTRGGGLVLGETPARTAAREAVAMLDAPSDAELERLTMERREIQKKAAEAAGHELETEIGDMRLYAIQAAGPLGLLVKMALDGAAADPSQIASVFAVMPAGDKRKVDMMAKDVLEMAKSMPGITGPLDFFDPLGFCTDCSEGKLCFYREVELKHGRVAMLAALGFLVGENFHPLFGGDIDVPSYLAFQQTPLETFWPAVVAAIAIPEIYSVYDFNEPSYNTEKWTMKTDRVPGDQGFDPLGLKPEDAAELKEMQTKELNNGRLAMIGAAGMIAQELVSGEKIFA
jgi:hypothetical protein